MKRALGALYVVIGVTSLGLTASACVGSVAEPEERGEAASVAPEPEEVGEAASAVCAFGGSCWAGQTCCTSRTTSYCADLQTDEANCGSCFTSCSNGAQCSAGHCCTDPPGATAHYAWCGGPQCISLGTHDNCAFCGDSCLVQGKLCAPDAPFVWSCHPH